MGKSTYKQEVLTYFRKKADLYDLVDEQSYWQLSDDLLWFAFKQVLDSLPKDFTFLDAGGGTGRWTLKILENYPRSKGIIYDLSEDMLEIVRQKSKSKKVEKRVQIIVGDLSTLRLSNNDEISVSFNFHNVLGFVPSPKIVIQNLANVTKEGGFVVSLVPNLYHNIFFNIMLGKLERAKKTLSSSSGKFTDDMPDINLFTPDSISDLYSKAGLIVTKLSGFPITIYPGFQETQLVGSTAFLQDILSKKENYDTILDIEKSLLSTNDASSRGNNILIIGKKK